MKRVALYIRVSSEKQAKSGDSLREQEDTLKEYVKSQKDMIIHSTYIDDGISGQKLDRDEFQRLMTDVKNNQIDVILFTKLDRWFRSLKHYLNIEDVLQKYNTHWIAVSQPFYDTSTPYGRTFINQVMSFAELEAQMTSERMIAIFEHKIKMGEVASGSTPFGYSIKNKRLVPNEDAYIVKELFEFQNKHVNLLKTSEYLYKTHSIERSNVALRRMFQNKRYIGIHRSNHNYCEPLVSKELFNEVNEQLERQRNVRNDAKNIYIFTGLLVCGDCNHHLNSRQRGSTRKLADGTIRRYKKSSNYICRHAYMYPRCINTKTVREDTLEQYLIDNIASLAQEQLVKLTADKKEYKKDNSKQLIEKVNTKLERLKKLYLNEIISLDEYQKDREVLMKELSEIEYTEEPQIEIAIENLNNILHSNLFEHYNELSKSDKKIFWRKFIKRITADNNKNFTVEFK